MIEAILLTLIILAVVVSVGNYIYRLIKQPVKKTEDNCEPTKCGYCSTNSNCEELTNMIVKKNNMKVGTQE